MIERQIKLPATEDVKEFVTEASRCDFDIDVFYNRVVIDVYKRQAFGVCEVVVAERPVSLSDLSDDILRIVSDIGQEYFFFHRPFCDSGKLHLPVGCQLRLF